MRHYKKENILHQTQAIEVKMNERNTEQKKMGSQHKLCRH